MKYIVKVKGGYIEELFKPMYKSKLTNNFFDAQKFQDKEYLKLLMEKYDIDGKIIELNAQNVKKEIDKWLNEKRVITPEFDIDVFKLTRTKVIFTILKAYGDFGEEDELSILFFIFIALETLKKVKRENEEHKDEYKSLKSLANLILSIDKENMVEEIEDYKEKLVSLILDI